MEKQQKLQIFAVFCCVASFFLYIVKKDGHRKKIGRAAKNRAGSDQGAAGAPGFLSGERLAGWPSALTV
ncbi:hypothetical protein [Janthinobacterium sp. PSRC1-1]